MSWLCPNQCQKGHEIFSVDTDISQKKNKAKMRWNLFFAVITLIMWCQVHCHKAELNHNNNINRYGGKIPKCEFILCRFYW
jgi:hypothetical protein